MYIYSVILQNILYYFTMMSDSMKRLDYTKVYFFQPFRYFFNNFDNIIINPIDSQLTMIVLWE